MLIATFLAVYLIPVLFVVVERIVGRGHAAADAARAAAKPDVPHGAEA
jgi:hypothetical protein